MRPAATHLSCLVIGLSRERRGLLAEAAESAGWHADECDDVKTARLRLLKESQQMVVMDLENDSGTAAPALKSFAERVGKQRGALLAICGNEGNAMEEIWARQLDVWLYLPGVVADSDLSTLFKEGVRIAARRKAAAERHAYFAKE
jgi:hypothetical protein